MSVYDYRRLCGAILASVVIGVLVFEGVGWGTSLFRHSQQDASAPSVPISVKLSLSYAPWMTRVAELTCSVNTVFQASNVSVEISLPEGFAVVSGGLSWRGNLPEKGKTDVKVMIRAVKVGNWTIEAVAGYPVGSGWYGDIARLCVSVSENSAYISPNPFPQTKGINQTRTTPPK